MPLPNFITNLFSGGASKIIETVSSTIDEFTLSKEEKEKFKAAMFEATNKHLESMAALAQAETESYLKDTQNARDANARIQESDKASWLSKNVAYCIDIFLVLIWGTMTIYLLARVLSIIKTSAIDLTGVYGLYSTVTAVVMTVVNFHRGTSRGSEDKSKQINKMVDAAAV